MRWEPSPENWFPRKWIRNVREKEKINMKKIVFLMPNKLNFMRFDDFALVSSD